MFDCICVLVAAVVALISKPRVEVAGVTFAAPLLFSCHFNVVVARQCFRALKLFLAEAAGGRKKWQVKYVSCVGKEQRQS